MFPLISCENKVLRYIFGGYVNLCITIAYFYNDRIISYINTISKFALVNIFLRSLHTKTYRSSSLFLKALISISLVDIP